MAPLSAELAEEIIGAAAKDKPSGTYVAARVAKKNAGKSEHVCYLERGEQGLLSRVYPAGEEEKMIEIMADAHQLKAEVDTREMNGNEPLAVTTAGQTAFQWGPARTRKAVEAAIEQGLLVKTKKSNGKGFILALPACNDQEEEEND